MNITLKEISAALFASTILQSSLAFAAVESARCRTSADSLDQPQAKGRSEWARKCYPQYAGIFGSSTSGGIDMVDANGTVFIGYPTFGIVGPNNQITYWVAPTDPNASCEGSSAYSLLGFCLGGCYTAEQQVLFGDGYRPIGDAATKSQTAVMSLRPEATFENLTYAPRPLKQIVTDLQPGTQEILMFKTQSGGSLNVTTNHPLVDGEGRMRSADTLKLGESLVQEDGTLDPIQAIEKKTVFDRVYNVSVVGEDPMEQIVLAQGYLNGSIHYQNEGVKDLNRQLLRRTSLIQSWVLKGE